MLSNTQLYLSIAILALGTLFLRAAPFLLFRNAEKTPKIILYLGRVLPAALMGMLVVYCLKDVQLLTSPHGIPEAIAIVAVILLHLWKRNSLLSIGGGTVLYMILVQLVFK
ncbi:MAG: branched-chain amino acid transporter AzlD [Ruminococcaceae bacterium]|nr:branched-chain amino acid transporter AzlD [Oscillospiraceae bacterium]